MPVSAIFDGIAARTRNARNAGLSSMSRIAARRLDRWETGWISEGGTIRHAMMPANAAITADVAKATLGPTRSATMPPTAVPQMLAVISAPMKIVTARERLASPPAATMWL